MKATHLSAIAWLIALGAFSTGLAAAVEPQFVPPASPRVTYNFNPGWRFIKEDVPDSEKPDLDDAKSLASW